MRRPVTRDDGISLIEMVIAVLVLSIGIVAGFQSLGQARRAIGDDLPRTLALHAAENRAEELKLLGMARGGALSASVRLGPYDWVLDVTTKGTAGGFTEATVRARADGVPGAMAVVYVPPPTP